MTCPPVGVPCAGASMANGPPGDPGGGAPRTTKSLEGFSGDTSRETPERDGSPAAIASPGGFSPEGRVAVAGAPGALPTGGAATTGFSLGGGATEVGLSLEEGGDGGAEGDGAEARPSSAGAGAVATADPGDGAGADGGAWGRSSGTGVGRATVGPAGDDAEFPVRPLGATTVPWSGGATLRDVLAADGSGAGIGRLSASRESGADRRGASGLGGGGGTTRSLAATGGAGTPERSTRAAGGGVGSRDASPSPRAARESADDGRASGGRGVGVERSSGWVVSPLMLSSRDSPAGTPGASVDDGVAVESWARRSSVEGESAPLLTSGSRTLEGARAPWSDRHGTASNHHRTGSRARPAMAAAIAWRVRGGRDRAASHTGH